MPPQSGIDSFWLTDHKRLPERLGSRMVLLADGLSTMRLTASRRRALSPSPCPERTPPACG